jgi:hypothetical protein
MISFSEACEQVGYNPTNPPPAHILKYFAYKAGEVREFEVMKDALAFSKTVEKVVANQEEINAFWDRQCDLERAAAKIWHEALREEYIDINGSQFNLIYDDAYDRGHSEGYDRVAAVFCNLHALCVAFADAGDK